jgi:hypothetical protein
MGIDGFTFREAATPSLTNATKSIPHR